MGRVQVEFPMWLGKDLGPEWIMPGDPRAKMVTDVPEGTTVRSLLSTLADKYPPIREKVFPDQKLARFVIATVNHTGRSPDETLDMSLAEGDVLSVMLIVVGG